MELWVKDDHENEYDLFTYFYQCMINSDHIDFIHGLIAKAKHESNYCELFQTTQNFNGLQNPPRYDLPKYNGENKEIMNMCSTIKLNNDEADGRQIVEAKKSLQPGVIIGVERPVILYCKPNCICVKRPSHHCHYCGVMIMLFVPCHKCEMTVYCNDKCLKKAWNEFHQWECDGIRRHFWKSTDAYFALRMLLIGIPFKFKSKWKFDTGKSKPKSAKNVYTSIFKLKIDICDKKKKEIFEILIQSTQTLVYLIERTAFFQMIVAKKVFPNKTLFECYMEIGARLVKHHFQAITNVMIVGQFHPFSQSLNNCISHTNEALCLSIGQFNHSCNANAVLVPVRNSIVIKALRKIKKGEEICINYYDPYDTIVQYRKANNKRGCNCKVCTISNFKEITNAYQCKKKKCSGKVLPSTLECMKCKSKLPEEETNQIVLEVLKFKYEFCETNDYYNLNLAIKTYETISHKYNTRLAKLQMDMAFYLIDKRFAKSYCNFMSAVAIFEKFLPKFSYFLLSKKLDYVSFVISDPPRPPAYSSCDGTELNMALKALKLIKAHATFYYQHANAEILGYEISKAETKLHVLKVQNKIKEAHKLK